MVKSILPLKMEFFPNEYEDMLTSIFLSIKLIKTLKLYSVQILRTSEHESEHLNCLRCTLEVVQVDISEKVNFS